MKKYIHPDSIIKIIEFPLAGPIAVVDLKNAHRMPDAIFYQKQIERLEREGVMVLIENRSNDIYVCDPRSNGAISASLVREGDAVVIIDGVPTVLPIKDAIPQGYIEIP